MNGDTWLTLAEALDELSQSRGADFPASTPTASDESPPIEQVAPEPRIAKLINELVAARIHAREHAADMAELREAWESEHAEELAALKSAKERLASADMALRSEALSLYDEHGGVPNAPGVGVKVRRVAKYNTDDAIGWAVKQNLRQFLAMNAKLFAKHALAVAGTAPLGFVTIARVPFATIAKNLDLWIGVKPEVGDGD